MNNPKPTVDSTEKELLDWFNDMVELHVTTAVSQRASRGDERVTRQTLLDFVRDLHRSHYELIAAVGSKLGLDSDLTYAEGRQKIIDWSNE